MIMHRLKSLIIFSLVIGWCAWQAQGKILYVDDDGPADYNMIQAAIDDANDSDIVVVEKGFYLENIYFNGKNIIVSSTAPKDPFVVAETIIDGGHIDSVVTFNGMENASCVLAGFTIQNGYQDVGLTKGGGGICGGATTSYTHATIVQNTIIRNFAWDGGGISRCNGLIEMNIIASNTARWFQGGGGLYECHGVLRNNIIVGNLAGGCESAGALSYCDAMIDNCTIAYNLSAGIGAVAYGSGTLNSCILWSNVPSAIETDFSFSYMDTDPCFADPGYWDSNDTPSNNDDVFILGDYHLKSQGGRYDDTIQSWIYDEVTSPCIDAGDPNSPIMHEPFSNGGIINMGAYGGTTEASKSYFNQPPCEIIIAGDINGDCRVDFNDMALLLRHWTDNCNCSN